MTPPPSYAVTVLGPDATRLHELATLDSHIRGIRAKLRTAGIPLAIRTCRGLGYAWVLPA